MSRERFEQLLEQMRNGELDPAGARDLNTIVRGDKTLAAAFVSEQMIHALLPEAVSRDAMRRMVSRRIGTEPRHTAVRRRALAIAASIVLFIGVGMSLLVAFAWDRHERLASEPRYFATLIHSRGAVFGESDVPTLAGSQLPGGFVRLERGEIDIEFFSGAQVTVTGPAVFGINSPMRAFLQRGQLRCTVPERAQGFTIGAPGLAVVDLGTEFGMTTDAQGRTSVLVWRGQVAVNRLDDAGRVVETVSLRENQTARRDQQGGISLGVVEPEPVHPYRQAVVDDEPAAYWPLDESPRDRAMADASGGGLNSINHAIAGFRAAGPLGGDGAMHLDGRSFVELGKSDRLGAMQAMTVEAFVWIDPALGRSRVISVAGGGERRTGWSLGVEHAGGTPRVMMTLYSVIDMIFEPPLPTGRWVHVAVVYQNRTAQLYLDGEAVQSITSPGESPAAPAVVNIGQDDRAEERWVGRLAHVAVYDRALSAAEIREHFNHGVTR